MTGLEVFFLILILVEFVILMYLFASLRSLREAHRVVSEMALDDAEAFTGSLARAKEQDDLERAKLIIEEAERYLNSYKNTLQKHYDRYSTEKSLSDFIPFLKKKETVTQTSRATSIKLPKTKKTAPEAKKEEEVRAPKPKSTTRKPLKKGSEKDVPKESAASESAKSSEKEDDDLLSSPD